MNTIYVGQTVEFEDLGRFRGTVTYLNAGQVYIAVVGYPDTFVRNTDECTPVSVLYLDNGMSSIAAERDRQVSAEGFTLEHDDQYEDGQLLNAAICYAQAAIEAERGQVLACPIRWPWNEIWWKTSPDPVRNLEKAGALIAAEIDRLKRKPDPLEALHGILDQLEQAGRVAHRDHLRSEIFKLVEEAKRQARKLGESR